MSPLRLSLLCLLSAGVMTTGCSRFETIGQEPEFTPPGTMHNPPPPVTPQRVAIATPRPTPAPEPHAVASLWRSGRSSLLGDRRAQGLGDILTVVIEIDDGAEISNASERRRAAEEDLTIDALLGIPGLVDQLTGIELDPAVGLGSDSDYVGDGSIRREEEIELRIAATVVDVLPNGHLVIRGNQELRVNYELRDLQVAGVVRPEDISRRNTIPYDKIAEARVAYGGRGQISDVQQPRYGQQAADVVLPF